MNPAFESLDGVSRDAVRAWLDQAMDERVQLPRAFPDEDAAHVILRHEPTFPPVLRRDLCAAVSALFASGIGQDRTDRLRALADLVVRLDLRDSGTLALTVVSDAERCAALPAEHVIVLLHVITDLRIPTPDGFWRTLAERDPAAWAVAAMGALLPERPTEALGLLPLVPDRLDALEALDLLFTVDLDALPEVELAHARDAARRHLTACRPRVAARAAEWAGPAPAMTPLRGEAARAAELVGSAPAQRHPLRAALAAKHRLPNPQPARLAA
jgi:hypothetical protein